MEFDFSQPVDSIDKVPEQFRPLYSQGQDGKFAVGDAFKGVTGAIIGLNTSLKAARTDAQNAGKKVVDLTPLAEFGADPAAIAQTFQTRLAEAVAKGGDAAKATERVRAEMAAAHATAMTAQEAKTSALRNQLYGHLVKTQALTAVAEQKGVPELLMPFIEQQVKVSDADGQFNVNVVDERGEIRYSGITGQPMSIKELVAEMKANAKYGRLFESEAPAGGGFRPGAGKAPAPNAPAPKTSIGKINAGLEARMRGRGGR